MICLKTCIQSLCWEVYAWLIKSGLVTTAWVLGRGCVMPVSLLYLTAAMAQDEQTLTRTVVSAGVLHSDACCRDVFWLLFVTCDILTPVAAMCFVFC